MAYFGELIKKDDAKVRKKQEDKFAHAIRGLQMFNKDAEVIADSSLFQLNKQTMEKSRFNNRRQSALVMMERDEVNLKLGTESGGKTMGRVASVTLLDHKEALINKNLESLKQIN